MYAAAVVAVAVLVAVILLLGANGPLLSMGGPSPARLGYWDLSDWTIVGALALLVLGPGCAVLLAIVGVTYRHNPKALWWVAASLLGWLGLKAIEWYR